MKRVLNSSIWPFSSLFPFTFFLFTLIGVLRDSLLLCPKTPYLTPLVATGQRRAHRAQRTAYGVRWTATAQNPVIMTRNS